VTHLAGVGIIEPEQIIKTDVEIVNPDFIEIKMEKPSKKKKGE
jgi:hypothetical protein